MKTKTNEQYLTRFPSNLRIAREEKAMTQQALAEAVNVQQATIAHYELGDIKPSAGVLLALADALSIPVTRLVERL